MNEDALAHWGLLCQKQTISRSTFVLTHCSSFCCILVIIVHVPHRLAVAVNGAGMSVDLITKSSLWTIKGLITDKHKNKVILWDYVSGRWKKKMESYHDIFLEREKQRSDESKRIGPAISSSELLGFEGSFRKLDVD